jgi:cytidylate kinase
MLITVCRQFGAGGSEVARRVADRLGWTLVNNQFLDEVAARAGMTPEQVAQHEERTPSFLDRLSRYTAMTFPEIAVPPADVPEDFDEAKLVRITRNLVTEFAAEGRVVFVGRAAAAVLAEADNAIHVRLVAPVPYRARVVEERREIGHAEVMQAIKERDKNRERYHREYYGREWDDELNYHMILNTELLGFDGAADLIITHARSLNW